jgi:hypothetical protein
MPLPEFPLDTLGLGVGKLRSPGGAFEPRKPWEQTWGVYTLAGRAGRAGQLSIRRRVGALGNVALDVAYAKLCTGGRQKVAATLHTRDGALSTPLRWSFEAELLDAAGKPVPQTRVERTATAKGKTVEISGPPARRVLEVDGAYTVNWAVFDAVQRLPRERTAALGFTLIDHFDELKPGHTLAWRKTVEVAAGGRRLRLHGYDQVGEGVVPWVYWVDGAGRLVCVVAGLEAYLLEASKQT